MTRFAKGNQIEQLFAFDPLGRARQTIGRVNAVMNFSRTPAAAAFTDAVRALEYQPARGGVKRSPRRGSSD